MERAGRGWAGRRNKTNNVRSDVRGSETSQSTRELNSDPLEDRHMRPSVWHTRTSNAC